MSHDSWTCTDAMAPVSKKGRHRGGKTTHVTVSVNNDDMPEPVTATTDSLPPPPVHVGVDLAVGSPKEVSAERWLNLNHMTLKKTCDTT